MFLLSISPYQMDSLRSSQCSSLALTKCCLLWDRLHFALIYRQNLESYILCSTPACWSHEWGDQFRDQRWIGNHLTWLGKLMRNLKLKTYYNIGCANMGDALLMSTLSCGRVMVSMMLLGNLRRIWNMHRTYWPSLRANLALLRGKDLFWEIGMCVFWGQVLQRGLLGPRQQRV